MIRYNRFHRAASIRLGWPWAYVEVSRSQFGTLVRYGTGHRAIEVFWR